ncbi:MAG: hypothetical protein KIG65_09180 [Eubacteriales bacterium]|nr:hypothetical protein [Eubacteriales bacterium]
MKNYIGVDTSNYTTSFAICGNIERSVRKILPVAEGQRGIRQSDGVFMHIKQAPALYDKLMEGIAPDTVKAVGVSTRPRSVEGSYMPVFLAGKTFANIISSTIGVPLYELSHQDGHIMAGILSSGREDLLNTEFYSVHLSGGTFEILKTRYNGYNFDTEIVGGTKDISAGQLIDRVGVACGMGFPCGKEVSRLASISEGKVPLFSVSENNGYINLSGAEAQAMKLVGSVQTENICMALIECIGKSIIKALRSLSANKVLFAGGVVSSDVLREYLIKNSDIECIFASKEMSSDNAWGIAKLVQMKG